MEKPEISNGAAVAILVAVVFAILFVINLPSGALTWEGWAGWAQAVFSVLAIVAAIEISRHQAKVAKQRELNQEVRDQIVMLESIATEVRAAWSNFLEQVGGGLPVAETSLDQSKFAIADQPFPVYRALVPRIATIENSQLRSDIVKIYSQASSLLLKLGLHNELVKEQDDLEFKLATATTLPSKASITEVENILAVHDVTAVGLSQHDTLTRQLSKAIKQITNVDGQILAAVNNLHPVVQDVLTRISEDVDKLKKTLPE
ncbi:hypothetical protein ACH58_07580 [Achromobacter xylosoxidans]|uniref:hypothetical protein n=1 Tax=Alcaligenes xylosoxydans xylosoxydans TaxID=85698 RepID=UPI00064DBDC4|nr:hypothetical protein [Achromobacter xylosoxidans]KMJ92477.1 hypothetical protein ACH58_07580 [Achromobacter xylosoxidans]